MTEWTRPPEYRDEKLRALPGVYGAYALCDLDNQPIYVGQSFGGKDDHIRSRVRRHLTSARSDVIANRLIDVWEVGYVRAWVCDQKDSAHTDAVERALFAKYNATKTLMNGEELSGPTTAPTIPRFQQVQILPDEEITRRLKTEYRFPRQLAHIEQMVDWLLEVAKERGAKPKAPMIRRALKAHFERLNAYHDVLQASPLHPTTP